MTTILHDNRRMQLARSDGPEPRYLIELLDVDDAWFTLEELRELDRAIARETRAGAIRVHNHPDRPTMDAYEDFPATSAAVARDGALILTRVEVRETIDPSTLKIRQEFAGGQLVRIIPAGLWGHVENLDLNDAGPQD
ncbi:MAG TPA: hypothetical protein VEQ15_00350 [Myxococcales bacterium]|nr:hypothetical protein [Myxococcales bacterium]